MISGFKLLMRMPPGSMGCVQDKPLSDQHKQGHGEVTISLSRAAVCSSAGKKVSSASSDRVMSTGVPNTMVVEKKLNTSVPRRIRSGIATLSAEIGAERAGIG